MKAKPIPFQTWSPQPMRFEPMLGPCMKRSVSCTPINIGIDPGIVSNRRKPTMRTNSNAAVARTPASTASKPAVISLRQPTPAATATTRIHTPNAGSIATSPRRCSDIALPADQSKASGDTDAAMSATPVATNSPTDKFSLCIAIIGSVTDNATSGRGGQAGRPNLPAWQCRQCAA
jgi:hypothetical protein